MKNQTYKPVIIEWGGKQDEKQAIRSQVNMTDPANPYNHIGLPANRKDGKASELTKLRIINRGNNNQAPQIDLELGRSSVTHNKIASGLSELVAGNGLYFELIEQTDAPSPEQIAQLEKANSFLELGLQDSVRIVANGKVYFNLGCIIANQKSVKFDPATGKAAPIALRFNARPNEQLRYSQSKMNQQGTYINEYHIYHENWGYDGFNDYHSCGVPLIDIISIEEYLKLSNSGKLYQATAERPNELTPAYYVKNAKADFSFKESFVSFAFTGGRGIFDNAYPLPVWKTNTSINAIQAEFETSCIYTDYLRNGMHIFAVVNVYSTKFKNTISNESDGSSDESWAESNETIKSLKKSYNSGRVLVNPVQTDDLSKDGTIEIKEIKLEFPVEATRYFNEESRAAILTAWGVMADLFGISKPEKNNLRSQGEFMKLGIILLQSRVRSTQQEMERDYDEILHYYGITGVKSRITPKENSAFLTVLNEFAAAYMLIDEIRELLGLSSLTDEQKQQLIDEKTALLGRMQQQGADVSGVIDETENQN